MTFLFHSIRFVLKGMNRGWRKIKTMLPPVCVKSFFLSVLSFWEEKQDLQQHQNHFCIPRLMTFTRNSFMAPVALLSGTAVTFHEPDSWGCSSPFIDFPQNLMQKRKKTERCSLPKSRSKVMNSCRWCHQKR